MPDRAKIQYVPMGQVGEMLARHSEEYRKELDEVANAAVELAVIRKMAEDAITVAHLGDMVAAHFGRTDLT